MAWNSLEQAIVYWLLAGLITDWVLNSYLGFRARKMRAQWRISILPGIHEMAHVAYETGQYKEGREKVKAYIKMFADRFPKPCVGNISSLYNAGLQAYVKEFSKLSGGPLND